MLNKIIILVSILIYSLAYAQLPNEELARQFMLNGEFEKAAAEYEKLYSKIPNQFYLEEWIEACIQLKEYNKAEKLIKKQIKQQEYNLALRVQLGKLYELQNDLAKSKKEYEKSISLLEPQQEQIFGLYQAFFNIQEYDYCIETLFKGRKLLKGTYPFSIELADVYQQKGDYSGMFGEYLSLLDLGQGYLQQVQSIIQNRIDEDPSSERNQLLKSQLLKKIQTNAENTLYNEFYAWLLMQEKNFDGAFVQLKTLDKRNKEEGGRLMALAPIALNNENYDVAVKSYEYVIAKGKDNFYYSQAKMELVKTLQKKLTAGQYTSIDLQQLEIQYLTTIEELGKNQNTLFFLKDLAHLYAFYLHQPEKSIALLNECLEFKATNERSKAECKMELADILVFTGEVWESALLYGQVEKQFKEDPLGQEAKYRNAKLSFYRGEFSWAQAQLDVLMASTSKFIANDALYLSLLIIENSGLDSNTTPLLMYARSELLYFQNKFDECLLTLDSVNKEFSGHALADDILFKKAQIAQTKSDFILAEKLYAEVFNTYNYDLLADDALINMARINEKYLNNKVKAQEYYQKLLTDFSGSLYVVEARRAYRQLRGDKVN